MSLTELLLQARAKKAQQFLFIVGSEPRIKVGSAWVTLRSSPALMTEWNLLQQSLLSSQQKAIFETQGVIQGETAIESLRIGFSFFQQDATMKALLNLDSDGTRQEMQIPQSVLDNALRMKGLMLLTGPGDSGQNWALHRLLQKMGEEKPFLGVVFSQSTFPQIKENKASFLYHTGTLREEESKHLLAGADVVVFSGLQDEKDFLQALHLAEQGVFVIYSMSSPTIGNALRRLISALIPKSAHHGAIRLSEILSVVMAQYALPGLNGESAYAHEVLLMKPQVRTLLEKQDVRGIEELLASSSENSGMISLNQSLLQHLIRRRIDLKTAFETSHDPDALDQLLKKVGI